MFSSGFRAMLLMALAVPAAANRIVTQDMMLMSEGPAAAGRMAATGKSLQSTNRSKTGSGKLQIITAYLNEAHIQEKILKHNIKCCCDASSSTLWYHRVHSLGANERTKRCMLYGQAGKCGAYKPSWAEYSLSSKETADNMDCQVSDTKKTYPNREGGSDLEYIYLQLGSPAEYCKPVSLQNGRLEPTGAIMMKKTFEVKCEANYEPEQKNIKCLYNGVEHGKLEKPPLCKMVCAATEDSDLEGKPKVSKATLGEPGTVSCEDGYLPDPDVQPTCQNDGSFEPKPACKKQADYCKAKTFDLPGSPELIAASLGDKVTVTCQKGWDSSFQQVECTKDGYEPQPVCSKVAGYCHGAGLKILPPGEPMLSPAMVDEPMEAVGCLAPGYELVKGATVTCGEDGEPVFDADKPVCVKNKHFCVFSSIDEESGLKLSQTDAEIDQEVTVTCSDGYTPEEETVICGGFGEFNPEPKCKQD